VKFVSTNPYKILVTGRIKHFISAFGEHVIGEEVEKAMKRTCEKHSEVEIVEFTVAPSVNPEKGNSRILQKLKVYALKPRSFINYMQSLGKLGGQNKVPRLSNDRKIADELIKFI